MYRWCPMSHHNLQLVPYPVRTVCVQHVSYLFLCSFLVLVHHMGYQHQILSIIILGVYFEVLQTVWRIIQYFPSLNVFSDVTPEVTVTPVQWWIYPIMYRFSHRLFIMSPHFDTIVATSHIHLLNRYYILDALHPKKFKRGNTKSIIKIDELKIHFLNNLLVTYQRYSLKHVKNIFYINTTRSYALHTTVNNECAIFHSFKQ